MSDTRIKQLQDRIKDLKALRKLEMKGERSELYIQDLDESIKHCESQLAFIDKNPGGFEYVNGR